MGRHPIWVNFEGTHTIEHLVHFGDLGHMSRVTSTGPRRRQKSSMSTLLNSLTPTNILSDTCHGCDFQSPHSSIDPMDQSGVDELVETIHA